jgi:hypothetical protein
MVTTQRARAIAQRADIECDVERIPGGDDNGCDNYGQHISGGSAQQPRAASLVSGDGQGLFHGVAITMPAAVPTTFAITSSVEVMRPAKSI